MKSNIRVRSFGDCRSPGTGVFFRRITFGWRPIRGSQPLTEEDSGPMSWNFSSIPLGFPYCCTVRALDLVRNLVGTVRKPYSSRTLGEQTMSEKSEKKETDSTVPQAVVSRLSLYLRELQQLTNNGQDTISSTKLGRALGFTDAQVRKDLAFFGQFGYPGLGYRCEELVTEIKRILGTDKTWPVVIVGVGNLGRALLGYRGFRQKGFEVVAAFDTDEAVIGKTIEGTHVHHIDDLAKMASQRELKLGVVAVPAAAAQSVADLLVNAGVEGILNFSPLTLDDKKVGVVAVDLAIELEQLTFTVVNRRKNT